MVLWMIRWVLRSSAVMERGVLGVCPFCIEIETELTGSGL
jgi:hypothetical protein